MRAGIPQYIFGAIRFGLRYNRLLSGLSREEVSQHEDSVSASRAQTIFI